MKAGWLSSEFLLTLLTNVVAIVGGLAGVVPPDIAAIIVAVANGLYGVIRAITKKGAVIVETKVVTTPATGTTPEPAVVTSVTTTKPAV